MLMYIVHVDRVLHEGKRYVVFHLVLAVLVIFVKHTQQRTIKLIPTHVTHDKTHTSYVPCIYSRLDWSACT